MQESDLVKFREVGPFQARAAHSKFTQCLRRPPDLLALSVLLLLALAHVHSSNMSLKVSITSASLISLSNPNMSPGSKTDGIPSAEVTLRLLSHLEAEFYFTVCSANRMSHTSSTTK